ncbi:MAG: hypothetical protein K2W82_07200 [Candidatus Obscuribacterales bacterium]|nr:hypothetical protein [Candidatus Obscuribacterales bacterium]
MLNTILTVLIASFAASSLPVDLQAPPAGVLAASQKKGLVLIAQKYQDEDPHGPDPRGFDPHDEIHDKTMPAYMEQKANKAPKEVYGRDVPNTRIPYEM